MLQYFKSDYSFDLKLSDNIFHFIYVIVAKYLTDFNILISEKIINDILDLYVKFFGILIGSLFANYLFGHSPNNSFSKFLMQYTGGI